MCVEECTAVMEGQRGYIEQLMNAGAGREANVTSLEIEAGSKHPRGQGDTAR